MEKLKQIPFYTFLLAFFFCLHGAAENFGFVTPGDVLKPGLLILFFLTVIFLLIFLWSKKILYAGLLTFFIGTWYFFFGDIKDSLATLPAIDHYFLVIPFLIAATGFVTLFFRKKYALLTRVTLFLNVLLIAYCVYDGLVIGVKALRGEKAFFPNNPVLNKANVKDRPNVYFLLPDEYAGYQSLSEKFSFKNDTFYSELKADGFSILNTFSNYHYTSFSVSSILNMDYLPALNEPGKVTWQDVERRKLEIKDAAVFQYFKQIGYTIKAFSVFDAADDKMIGGNTFMKGHEYILTQKILHNRLFKVFGWSFPNAVKSIPFMHEFDPDDLIDYNDKVIAGLLHNLHKKNASPKFVYAHLFLPHHPYLYDSSGKKYIYNSDLMNREDAYLSYLKYSNKKIMEITGEIIKADPGAIIIIMSDHGYRDMTYTLGPKSFYYNNICAVRNVLQPQTAIPAFSNVNFFRYLFNTVYSQHFSYLADSTVALSDKYHIVGDY